MAGKVLLLFAHPAIHRSRVNKALVNGIRGMRDVTIHDLYEEYPDFYIHVKREQDLLLEHQVIILQHPFYWYSSPALIKEWEDLVLQWGFAYGTGGTRLTGKLILNAITTGGPEEAYSREGFNHFTIRELLVPFEQTARLCGMHYLPPFVVHGSLRLTDPVQLDSYVDQYRNVVAGLRDEELDLTSIKPLPHINGVFSPIVEES